MPSIDSKVKPAEMARPVGRLAAPSLERACLRAPGPSHGLEPNRLSLERSGFRKCCIILHDATISRAIETYIGQTAAVFKNQHTLGTVLPTVSFLCGRKMRFLYLSLSLS